MGYCGSGCRSAKLDPVEMNEIRTITSRLARSNTIPRKTILFVEGLVGFEDLRHFVVIPNQKEGPLFWIQSVEDPQVAFILTDPSQFFCDYRVVPEKGGKRETRYGGRG